MKAAKLLKNFGATIKGHPLCWHTGCAQWLLKYDNKTILEKQLARIYRDVGDFKGIIDMWDVINEVVIMPIYDKYDNAITRLCKEHGRIGLCKKVFEAAKKAKLAEVDVWTANKITGGFDSKATGAKVRYDSDKDTQLTMQGIALNVNTALFAEKYPTGCPVRGYAEGASEKSIFMLTPEQVMLWCADLSMHIGNCKQAGWMKQAEVAAATTKEQLEAIILD